MEANETPRNPPTSLESESRKETRGLIPFPSLSPKDNKLWKLGEREREIARDDKDRLLIKTSERRGEERRWEARARKKSEGG